MPAKAAPSKDEENIVQYPRVQNGPFFADFMRDKRIHPAVYHCVIQRDGSHEILYWTQCSSLEDAQDAAQTHLALIAGSSIQELG